MIKAKVIDGKVWYVLDDPNKLYTIPNGTVVRCGKKFKKIVMIYSTQYTAVKIFALRHYL